MSEKRIFYRETVKDLRGQVAKQATTPEVLAVREFLDSLLAVDTDGLNYPLEKPWEASFAVALPNGQTLALTLREFPVPGVDLELMNRE